MFNDILVVAKLSKKGPTPNANTYTTCFVLCFPVQRLNFVSFYFRYKALAVINVADVIAVDIPECDVKTTTTTTIDNKYILISFKI